MKEAAKLFFSAGIIFLFIVLILPFSASSSSELDFNFIEAGRYSPLFSLSPSVCYSRVRFGMPPSAWTPGDTLQSAYNSASNNQYVESVGMTFIEDLILAQDKHVTFAGGYSCDFLTFPYTTGLNGSLTISAGSATIEDLVIDGCPSGFSNCDGSQNGCQKNIAIDINNCGGCGLICPSGVCSGGVCQMATGSACTFSSQCIAGSCVDGYCCGSSCNSTCMACSSALTGMPNGICSNVLSGIDPHNNCGGSTCNAQGSCMGCGNGVIEGSEQCDDGNVNNLDGCNSTCKYEVFTRVTSITFSGTTAPAALGCTPATNKLGTAAWTSTALSQFNPDLTNEVNGGSGNLLFQFLGIDDLTGVTDSALQLGVVSAVLDPAKGTWPGNNPIDWWFLIDKSGLDASNLPVNLLTAGLNNRNLTAAGPNDITISLGSILPNLRMRSMRLAATVNGNPSANTPAPPPQLLAPSVKVFQTITGNGAGQGICGNITVESLAKVPVPQEFAAGGTYACTGLCSGSHSYTYCGAGQPVGPGCNSMLDMIIGGCKAPVICIAAVNPTQPDVTGDGYQGTLTIGTSNKVPDTQTTGNTRSYSAYFMFTANRAHATGTTP
jgi:cysteine-rich repeat protein